MRLAAQVEALVVDVLVTASVRHEPLSQDESVMSVARRALPVDGVDAAGDALAVWVDDGLADALGVEVGVAEGLGVGSAEALAIGVALAVGAVDAWLPLTSSTDGMALPLMQTPVSV